MPRGGCCLWALLLLLVAHAGDDAAAVTPSPDAPCVLSGWGIWSQCTGTCGGGAGTQTRTRVILQNARGTGTPCPAAAALTETQACVNSIVCPATPTPPTPPASVCVLSGWSPWSACDATCGAGNQQRTRSVISNSAAPTPCPDPLNEAQPCDPPLPACPPVTAPPVVVPPGCQLSAWSQWSGCPAALPCGQTFKETRTKNVLQNPTNDPLCIAQQEERDCPALPCPPVTAPPAPACEGYTGWGLWSDCDAPCGGGSQKRNRALLCPSCPNAGLCTGNLQEDRVCNNNACNPPPVDCVMGPVTTTPCSIACCETPGCPGGFERKFKSIVTQPTPGGKPCDTQEEIIYGCNKQDCPAIDCAVGMWSGWSACDTPCGGVGAQTRFRDITTEPKFGGAACPDIGETRDCIPAPPACMTQCTYGGWSGSDTPETAGWTPCTATCGGGTTFRQQQLLQPPGGGGTCDFCDGTLMGTYAVEGTNPGWSQAATYQANMPGAWTPLPAAWAGAQFLSGGGTFCLQEAPCSTQACQDIDCVVSLWSTWSECSKRCRNAQLDPMGGGGTILSPPGTRERTRYIVTPPEGAGTPCPALSISEDCNDFPCDVDCIPSAWSEWGKCSGGCWDPGVATPRPTQVRTRSVVVAKQYNGRDCGALTETQFCETSPCSQACVVDDWSPWLQCDLACGGGTQSREREVIFPALTNGVIQPCGVPTTESRPCNTQACRVGDCEVSTWGAWGPCLAPSGAPATCAGGPSPAGGLTIRQRQVSVFPSATGAPCPILNETKSCNTHLCPMGCVVGEWTPWPACSVPCGGGTTTRKRIGDTPPVNGGDACPTPTEETAPCGVEPCTPNSCRVSEWSGWTLCSETCGGGVQMRVRNVTQAPPQGSAGSACPALSEHRMCNTQICPADCAIGGWGEWSECSASCGGGSRESLAHLLRPASGGGAPCTSLRREEDCNQGQCLVGACVTSAWSPWTPCTQPCGGGTQWRTRGVASTPSPPNACPPLEESRVCNLQPCPVDCVVGAWSGWDLCSAECGHGATRRRRPILQNATGSGEGCPSVFEIQACRNRDCPLDSAADACSVTPFGEWGACSASCGGGVQQRSREILLKTGSGVCPAELITEADCGQQPCPTHCEMTPWGDWTLCSTPCDPRGGVQTRKRWVKAYPTGGGTPCPHAEETRRCNQIACQPRVCRVSPWGSWGVCSSGCGGDGVQKRARSVTDIGDGSGCPVLEESAGCNRQPCGSDCAVSEWQPWTLCSATCGGGTQTRDRWVIQTRSGPGKICPGLTQRRACGESDPCTPGSCSAGAWSAWSTCTSSCGGGTQTRSRELPSDGSCPNTPASETRICNAGPCNPGSGGGGGGGGGGGSPVAASSSHLLPLGMAALCADLWLDGTLSVVRPGDSIRWTTTSSSTSLQVALGSLEGNLTGSLDLQAVLGPSTSPSGGQGTYLICLTVGSSTPSCQAAGVVEMDFSIRALLEGGPRRSAVASRGIHLHVTASLERCGSDTGTPSGTSLKFQWSGLPDSVAAAFASSGKSLGYPSLHIPGGSLPVGTHLLSCEVCAAGLSPAAGGLPCKTVVAEVAVGLPDLVAVIGRNNGSVSAADVASGFSLEAAESHDPAGEPGHLEYVWSCAQPDRDGPQCPPGYPTVPSASPAHALSPSQLPGAYVFSLVVQKGSRVSPPHAVAISVLPAGSQDIPLFILCSGGGGGAAGGGGAGGACVSAPAFDPSQKLSLVAEPGGMGAGGAALEYDWGVVGLPQLRLLTDAEGRYAVLPAGSLELGRAYTVRLTAVSGGRTGSAELSLTTLMPPAGGSCSLQPASGSAMRTLFSVQCTGWSCPDGSVPSYRFEAGGFGPLGAGYRHMAALTGVMLPPVPSGSTAVTAQIRCDNNAVRTYTGDGTTASITSGTLADTAALYSQLYAAVAQGRMPDALRYLNLAGGQATLDGVFSAQNLTQTYLGLRQAPDTSAETDDLAHAALTLSRRFDAVEPDTVMDVLKSTLALVSPTSPAAAGISDATSQAALDISQRCIDRGVLEGNTEGLAALRGIADSLLDVMLSRASPGEPSQQLSTRDLGVAGFRLIKQEVEGLESPLFKLGWGVRAPFGFTNGSTGYAVRTAVYRKFPFPGSAAENVQSWSLSVKVKDLQTGASITSFDVASPLRIVLPLGGAASAEPGSPSPSPVYYDGLQSDWRNDGLTYISSGVDPASGVPVVVIDTLHTTFFGAKSGAAVAEGVGGGGGGSSNTLVWVAVVCAVLCCCIVFAFFLIRRRRLKQREARYEQGGEAGAGKEAPQDLPVVPEPQPERAAVAGGGGGGGGGGPVTHNPIPHAFPVSGDDGGRSSGAGSEVEMMGRYHPGAGAALPPGSRIIDVGDE